MYVFSCQRNMNIGVSDCFVVAGRSCLRWVVYLEQFQVQLLRSNKREKKDLEGEFFLFCRVGF